MRQYYILSLLVFCLLTHVQSAKAQSKIKASTDFTFLPERGEDQYNQRITHKTIPLSQNAFIMLSRQTSDSYAIEKYDADLKKAWQAKIPLTTTETVEDFFRTTDAAVIITRRTNENVQQLYGHYVGLKNGQNQDPILLLEAPVKSRRAGIATSADGSRILTYRYHTDNNHHIRDISSTLYDGSFRKIQDFKYNLNDMQGILTAEVKVSNSGEQYLCLISEDMNRLTVRQYSPGAQTAKAMSVLVGGVYGGIKVYILDSKFELMPDNTLYGAVLTAEEETGNYYSLKAVKFDFGGNDMVFAEELKFTQAYVDKVTALDKSTTATHLEDIYLSDLLLSADGKLTVIAEKKYTEGGDNAPYYAKELHFFTYDEYMDTAWNSVLTKHQQAPVDEGFTGISYRAYLQEGILHLLTLEEVKGKYDLYTRQINTTTGQIGSAKGTLNLTNSKEQAYVKDFTAWLTDQNLIVVVRPRKRDATLKLYHIQLK